MDSILADFEKLALVSNTSFNLDSLVDEIETIRLVTESKRLGLEQVKTWISDNNTHSFPKTESKWIKTLAGNFHLCRVKIRYSPRKIILDILNKKRFPIALQEMENRITIMLDDYDNLDTNNLDAIVLELKPFCCKTVSLDSQKLFLALIEDGVLYREGRRIYINPPGDWGHRKRGCEETSNDLGKNKRRMV